MWELTQHAGNFGDELKHYIMLLVIFFLLPSSDSSRWLPPTEIYSSCPPTSDYSKDFQKQDAGFILYLVMRLNSGAFSFGFLQHGQNHIRLAVTPVLQTIVKLSFRSFRKVSDSAVYLVSPIRLIVRLYATEPSTELQALL